MTYLLNLIIIPFYYIILSRVITNKEKRYNSFFLIFGIHAVLFRVLANPLNYVDTDGYADAFEIISEMSLSEALTSQYVLWGVGYIFVNWFISRFSSDPLILFSFISIVSVSGVIWFYKKTSHSAIATALIYVIYPMLYLMGFGVLRQHLSIVFVLLSLYYVDKIKISIPLAVIAILLHTSSLVFIPFFLWKYFKIEKRNFFIVFSIMIFGFIFFRLSMYFLLSFFPRAQQTGFGEEGNNNLLPIIILGTTVFLFYYSKTAIRLKEECEKNIFSFIIYGLMISLFGFGLLGAGRLSLMFIYVFPVAITYLKTYSNNKRIYYSFFISILFLMFYIITSSYDPIDYDYITIWEPVKNYK